MVIESFLYGAELLRVVNLIASEWTVSKLLRDRACICFSCR